MKSKSSSKPIYKTQIEGAANTVKSVYDNNASNIGKVSADLLGLNTQLIDQYKQGDPLLTAAKGYNTEVLGGKYLDAGNPYLQQMVDRTNSSVRNQTQASLGTRGLTGGSDYAGIIANRLASNETGLRFQDYENERQRMATAAGQAPGLTAAELARIQPILETAQLGSMLPFNAVNSYANATGGLLGQYTKNTQTAALGPMLIQGASNAAAAFAGGR